jgi:hypothetical protein
MKLGNGPGGTNGPSITADTIQAAPVLNTPFVFCSLPSPGLYNVTWSVWLAGTLAEATDANNLELVTSAVGIADFIAQGFFPAVAGMYPQQPVYNIYVPRTTFGCYVAVQANPNAGSAGSIYAAQVICTPA